MSFIDAWRLLGVFIIVALLLVSFIGG